MYLPVSKKMLAKLVVTELSLSDGFGVAETLSVFWGWKSKDVFQDYICFTDIFFIVIFLYYSQINQLNLRSYFKVMQSIKMCKMRSSTFLFLLRCFLFGKSSCSYVYRLFNKSTFSRTLTLSLSLLSDKSNFQKVFLAISALKNLSKFLEKIPVTESFLL